MLLALGLGGVCARTPVHQDTHSEVTPKPETTSVGSFDSSDCSNDLKILNNGSIHPFLTNHKHSNVSKHFDLISDSETSII